MATLRELDYQARTLKVVESYLSALSEEQLRAEEVTLLSLANKRLGIPIPNFTVEAWNRLRDDGLLPVTRRDRQFSPRTDGVGRHVPNAVLKVPTGGGKTYLAVQALSRVFGQFLGKNTGFVLWIVPNEAIYSQTLRQLRDREHPYRQVLDRAGAGHVKVMTKLDPLSELDVRTNLCVMLLMLPSANRQTRESLKLFQDRGDIHGFLPDEGDQLAHNELLKQIPNLDPTATSSTLGSMWPLAKASLGNALRVIRPVVVIDEGHRATSPLAYQTVYGFNPCFVLELTATPKDLHDGSTARSANVLVEVTGQELDREGMIKMPLNLDPRPGTDWTETLAAAIERLRLLSRDAVQYHADNGVYLRPILLVQVERTGKEQRDGNYIHALDVKEWLLATGFDEAEIAIKTAEVNDLSSPENQDLLSPTNRIRVIITKQALQEGWDCPFAYILCALSAASSLTAVTQIVGRVLRQPYAAKTGVPSLDECYVITHHVETSEVVTAIKKALEEDGMGDLVKEVRVGDSENLRAGPRVIQRRPKFEYTKVTLPQVVWAGTHPPRMLDYESDVLFVIDWSHVGLAELVARIPDNIQETSHQLQRVSIGESAADPIRSESIGVLSIATEFDLSYAVRMLSDIVQNPWIAAAIVNQFTSQLSERGFGRDQQGEHATFLISKLRHWLIAERDRRAEELFRQQVSEGVIQFRLRVDGKLNWEMPSEATTLEPDNARQLMRKSGDPLQLSLFSPIYENDFSSSDEREVAVYLDTASTINWWHRNVAKRNFSLQGWRRERIYPDFVFSVQEDGSASRVAVLEVKGDHLSGSEETTYKKSVMRLLSENFRWDTATPAGELRICEHDQISVVCEMILMSERDLELPRLLSSKPLDSI